MARSDLGTFACRNPEGPQCRQAGQGNLVIRKVYGCAGIRLLRWGKLVGALGGGRRTSEQTRNVVQDAKSRRRPG